MDVLFLDLNRGNFACHCRSANRAYSSNLTVPKRYPGEPLRPGTLHIAQHAKHGIGKAGMTLGAPAQVNDDVFVSYRSKCPDYLDGRMPPKLLDQRFLRLAGPW